MSSTTPIHGLNTNEIDVLMKLIEAQASLGVDYINGCYLKGITDILRVNIPGRGGVWKTLYDGQLTFSLFYYGNKVPPTKALRIATGMGLKEAKDIVDQARICADGRHQLLITNATPDFFTSLICAAEEVDPEKVNVTVSTSVKVLLN